MSVRFNAPPGWPAPSPSWAPDDDWMPDPTWPAPPRGWEFWTVVDRRHDPRVEPRVDPRSADSGTSAAVPRFGTPPRSTAATYGTDRGSWLDGMRARASAAASVEERSTADIDAPWELDGVLTSAGRLDI